MTTANSGKSQQISYKITNSERQIFTILFSIVENKLQILINEKSSLSSSYKASFDVKNFQEINKFFRQFDTVEEIFEFIMSLDKPEEKLRIKVENKFTDLEIILPSMSKLRENNIKLKIPQIELNKNDLIVKLCQEVKKIDILESKINFLFHCCKKTEKEFYEYEEFMAQFDINILNKSEIVNPEDFMLVSKGIEEQLNKSIKGIKLLYRASEDGDLANNFHSKCDGKKNTVTFVKSTNGKRFGGFASKGWNSYGNWITDENCFVFSLDNKECYYYNNTGYMIYGCSSYGPVWGYYSNNYSVEVRPKILARNKKKRSKQSFNDSCIGYYDLCISNNCLSNNFSNTYQCSFNYKGKNSSLSGTNNFIVEDYETYELTLE